MILTPISLPLEIWYTICEYLPLPSLQHFKLSNRQMYNCISRHYQKLPYNEKINYSCLIAQQLIDLTTNFILFSFIDLYKSKIHSSSSSHKFIVVKNDPTCNVKTLFTISQLSCNMTRQPYEIKQKCVYENRNNILCHVEENNYCGGNINCNVPYNPNVYNVHHSHYKTHIHSDLLNLSIKDDHLNFTCSDSTCYDQEQYNCSNCTYRSNKFESRPLHNTVDGIPMYIPNIYVCGGTITNYNFVFDDEILTEIFKNMFVLKNRIISSFIKDGIQFYIATASNNTITKLTMENELSIRDSSFHCTACSIYSNCSGSCETCGAVCRACGNTTNCNVQRTHCTHCHTARIMCNSKYCYDCGTRCSDRNNECSACGVCFYRYKDCNYIKGIYERHAWLKKL